MDTWDAITARRNVREFSEEPLTEEQIRIILEAGRRAPSSRNWQPWDFVAVTERERLRELSGVWQGGGHIAGAALAVAFVIDEPADTRTALTARYDLGQASLQMMVAAADLGIGSGHSSVGDQDLARQVLGGVPEDKRVEFIVDFGFPADRPLKPILKPNRKPFEEVVHRETW
jgi:nitroreductase